MCASNDNGWSSLEKFKGFVDSFASLTDSEVTQQKLKADLFFRLASKQLKKHFDVWINNLFFLGLYSEATTAQTFARFLIETEETTTNPPETPTAIEPFHSAVHDRTIDLHDLFEFLKDRCTSKASILTSDHVRPHILIPIQQIAQRKDMWSEYTC